MLHEVKRRTAASSCHATLYVMDFLHRLWYSEAILLIKTMIILCYFCSAREKCYFFSTMCPVFAQALQRDGRHLNKSLAFYCEKYKNKMLGTYKMCIAYFLAGCKYVFMKTVL